MMGQLWRTCSNQMEMSARGWLPITNQQGVRNIAHELKTPLLMSVSGEHLEMLVGGRTGAGEVLFSMQEEESCPADSAGGDLRGFPGPGASLELHLQPVVGRKGRRAGMGCWNHCWRRLHFVKI